tara:strand:- start:513 stop:845 length:333 start_codon:yes stop_codon:yes gene_type:complete
MARRYMHGKRRKKRSPLLDNPTNVVSAKLIKENKKKDLVIKGSYGKGHASKSGHKFELGAESGRKTKYGDFSLTAHGIFDKGKHHNVKGGTLGIKYKADFDQIKNIFKKR